MHKRRRVFGTYLGVALAAYLLPGVSTMTYTPGWGAVLLSGSVFLILNQLIYSYPNDIRAVHPFSLLVLGAVGIVQDTLIWLLASWLGSVLGFGLHVEGFVAALLGGVIVRGCVLALLTLGPQPARAA